MIVRKNVASISGGGIGANSGATGVITDSEFYKNTAVQGGGLYFGGRSSLGMERCIISSNIAQTAGGGVAITDEGSNPTFSNCDFSKNEAGMSNLGSHSHVETCGSRRGGVVPSEVPELPEFLNSKISRRSRDISHCKVISVLF